MQIIRLVLLGSLVLIVSCSAEVTSSNKQNHSVDDRISLGGPRTFRLGFSNIPRTMSPVDQESIWDDAAQFGEVVVVHKTISWSEFVEGEFSVSEKYGDDIVALKQAASQRDLDLILVLDIFDSTAEQIAMLPATFDGSDFSDDLISSVLVNEVSFLARNLEPWAMIIGNEINSVFERNPDLYFSYIELYARLYERAKQINPAIIVAPSFSYEELLGSIPGTAQYGPRWSLIDPLTNIMDTFAFSSFPSYVYPAARSIPSDYYKQMIDEVELPISFLSAGFHVGEGIKEDQITTATEQRRFLERLLQESEDLEAIVLTWLLARDSEIIPERYESLASSGLFDEENAPRPGWAVWTKASRRPLAVPILD